jgi:hypothetical protein
MWMQLESMLPSYTISCSAVTCDEQKYAQELAHLSVKNKSRTSTMPR